MRETKTEPGQEIPKLSLNYSVQWVDGYIGSCDGKNRRIYLNERLIHFPWAYDQVLAHELKHLDYKGFYNKEDFWHDFTDGFDLKVQIPLFLWMLKNPITLVPGQWYLDSDGEGHAIVVLWPALVYFLALVILLVG